ncbi:MAG TPA: hypothetical protein VGM82_09870 [Gemmatimonadaceae bacterium]
MTTIDARSTTSAPSATARRWFELLVGGAAFVAYARSLTFGFIYDDTTVIRSNPQIQRWSSVLHALAQPYWGAGGEASGLYRPAFVALIGTLWNATNHLPLWFHLFAVLLHVAASIAVFRIASYAVGKWPAVIGALWFAVQPVHVEAIASVANSSEIMVALLALALAGMVWRRAQSAVELSWRWAIGAALLFAAACLVKESGVMLPALALVFAALWATPSLDWRQTRERLALARWWRVIVASIAMFALTIAARVAVLGALVPAAIAAPGLIGLSFTQRLWSMVALGPVASRLLLIPRELNPHYGPSYIAGVATSTTDAWMTIVALVVVVSISIVLARKGDGRLAAGVAWLLLAFVPASNIFSATGQIFAERTLYVSTIGSALIVAWVADRVRVLAMSGSTARKSTLRAVELFGGAVAALVLAFALQRTWRDLLPWRSHTALFAQMLVADPDSYRAHWLIGMDQRSRGQTDSAVTNLAYAYEAFPDDRQLVVDFAETLRARGSHTEAATVASRLMRWPELRRNDEALTLYLDETGHAFGADSVRVAGERLLDGASSSTAARFVGDAKLALGDSAGAKAAYQRGLALAPNDTALTRRVSALR